MSSKKTYSRRFNIVDTKDFEIQKEIDDTIEVLGDAGIEKTLQQICREGIKSKCQELKSLAKQTS